jgi:hypothetical protein
MEELALGNGQDKFFKAAGIVLDRLGDKEYSIFGERTMSKMLKEMMSNERYWFGQAIHDIYKFEYLFWEKLFPVSYRMSSD